MTSQEGKETNKKEAGKDDASAGSKCVRDMQTHSREGDWDQDNGLKVDRCWLRGHQTTNDLTPTRHFRIGKTTPVMDFTKTRNFKCLQDFFPLNSDCQEESTEARFGQKTTRVGSRLRQAHLRGSIHPRHGFDRRQRAILPPSAIR